ncbi:MAG TPA: cytochrome c [Candidatus Deferrimicrobiaceae bacterium]|nr:cytochrome c [Candidatus Deferrimicrobiaceae bacterium]
MRKRGMLLTGVVFLTCALAGIALAKTDGASVYQRCSSCHTSAGTGIGGVFPPLAGHAVKLVNADRTYPIQVLLFGLGGEIEVEGKKYNGAMPAFGDQLKDDEIAAVLNYVLSSWGNDKMLPKGHKEYTSAEVKDLRGKKLTAKQVLDARMKLKWK